MCFSKYLQKNVLLPWKEKTEWIFYELNCVPHPPNSCIEVWTDNLTVFGDRASKEVIKVKRGSKGEAFIHQDWRPSEDKKSDVSKTGE